MFQSSATPVSGFDKVVQETLARTNVKFSTADVSDLALPCIVVGLVVNRDTSAQASRRARQ